MADIAFSPTGKTLATLAGSFKLWNLSTDAVVDKLVSDEERGYAPVAAWAPDNIHLLYVSARDRSRYGTRRRVKRKSFEMTQHQLFARRFFGCAMGLRTCRSS